MEQFKCNRDVNVNFFVPVLSLEIGYGLSGHLQPFGSPTEHLDSQGNQDHRDYRHQCGGCNAAGGSTCTGKHSSASVASTQRMHPPPSSLAAAAVAAAARGMRCARGERREHEIEFSSLDCHTF